MEERIFELQWILGKFNKICIFGRKNFLIGGKARSLWSHYYENLNACIFVVDSTDKEKLYQVREEFVKLNEDLKFQNVTLLVFFNKLDCKGK